MATASAINPEHIKMLKTTLVQVNAAAKQVKKDIAADPKKLGELAGKGLSLNQVEDAVPVGLSMRAARALLETVIALAGDGATGSPVVDAASDQSASAQAGEAASEVSGAGESDKNDEEVSHGAPTYVQVAKGGNRKQRRAAAKGKGPAVV